MERGAFGVCSEARRSRCRFKGQRESPQQLIVLTPRTACFRRFFFCLKKEGAMKRFLLIFSLFLLFAAEAKALSCSSGQYYSAAYSCGDNSGFSAERCVSCPSGCSSCSGVRYWTTCQYWDKEKGEIRSYTNSTLGSCDSCNSGYELKKATTSSYDGSSYTSISYYRCERETTASVTCPANCSACSSSVCTACKSGYTLKNGKCVTVDSGKTGTVISCPDDMKLSADGCCCVAG